MAPIDVDNLTDSELRLKFSELGSPVGPVTATTRKILVKKLKSLLQEGGNVTLSSDSKREETSNTYDDTDVTTNSRRKSLPRTTNKSPSRRKSPARSSVGTLKSPSEQRSPVWSPDTVETSSAAILNGGKYPTRTVDPTDTSPTYVTSTRSEIYESPLSGTEISSPNSSKFLNSALGLGFNDSFRSRYKDSINDTDFNISNSQPTSPYTFSSDFVRRYSSSRNAQRSEFGTSPLVRMSSPSSKLLDVKESDDEDTGPTPVYAKFSQSGPRGSPVTNIKTLRRTLPNEGWLPFDSPISTILLIIFLLFFVVIGVTYVNMHSSDTNLSSAADVIIPVCVNMTTFVPGENCITEGDKEAVMRLFNTLYKELYESVINGPCIGRSKEPTFLTDNDIIDIIVEKDKAMSVWVVEQHLKNLKVLLHANPKWKIKPTGQGIVVEEPPVTYYCSILNQLYTACDWFFKISLSGIALYAFYFLIKWWMMREARYKEEVYKLVSSIVDIVSSRAQTPDSVVPISHVRDQLIPVKDRARMNKLWKDALLLLESDSRLRCEIQEVEGEEFLVWRWLASSLQSSKRKVWQGQAFDTMEGSVNSLPHSPTSCLKIRHMFDAVLEEGDDWVATVVNAILEKCGEAKILHVVVDRQSREGCVYMKCATPLDAGVAYRALHGSWFDSNLVTVKYIREKRYLERFPDSANCIEPLHPNTNKN